MTSNNNITNNIILAGVARSGSTLTCHLLNKTTDAVALHEPINPANVPVSSSDETINYIASFFEEQRRSILSEGVAQSKSTNGKVPDNPMGNFDSKTGKRIRVLDGNEIQIEKELKNNFKLIIKQPGLFTGMLAILTQHFSCYATIRNPLAVLRSWNTVDMAVTDGHAPAAEQCDSTLKAKLADEPDVYNRQLILLSWYYQQFYENLPNNNIIRYEETIESSGKNLINITPSASSLNELLKNKNNNSLYDESLKKKLSEKLLDSNGYYWKYYSKSEVTNLLLEE